MGDGKNLRIRKKKSRHYYQRYLAPRSVPCAGSTWLLAVACQGLIVGVVGVKLQDDGHRDEEARRAANWMVGGGVDDRGCGHGRPNGSLHLSGHHARELGLALSCQVLL